MPWPLPPRAYQADPTGPQAVHGVRVMTGRPAWSGRPARLARTGDVSAVRRLPGRWTWRLVLTHLARISTGLRASRYPRSQPGTTV